MTAIQERSGIIPDSTPETNLAVDADRLRKAFLDKLSLLPQVNDKLRSSEELNDPYLNFSFQRRGSSYQILNSVSGNTEDFRLFRTNLFGKLKVVHIRTVSEKANINEKDRVGFYDDNPVNTIEGQAAVNLASKELRKLGNRKVLLFQAKARKTIDRVRSKIK